MSKNKMSKNKYFSSLIKILLTTNFLLATAFYKYCLSSNKLNKESNFNYA